MRLNLPLLALGTALTAALTTLIAVPGAGAATAYPVTYNVAAANGVMADPSAPPAGANDFSCQPSAAHPHPVVLVHGLGATMGENWATMSPLLADNGYCVFALTYGRNADNPYVGGVMKMEDSSAELATFVDRVLAATGADKVDLVGHSEGTVMPQYYLKFRGGAAKVDKYVAITPIYRGTTLLGIGALITAMETAFPQYAGPLSSGFDQDCGSCQEFLAGSPFLTNLYADGVYAVPGVTYTTIMTRYDELVTPYTSGRLSAPNATNIVVQDQCPIDLAEHVAVAFDPTVAQDTLNALDPAHPLPVPCRLVLPMVGAPAG
ncbi:MAG: lipase family alpha/beta hydrolase [Jatrophihabitans sp.]|uniref:lipase family alpha/beta hydrolase n=1 Tax=Jatrophihabitans sp. TaxID=1932789 RepID=UPI003912F333